MENASIPAAAERVWRLRLGPGELTGNSVGWVAVDPFHETTRVWLLDTAGSAWSFDTEASEVNRDTDAPPDLRQLATTGIDLLAIDAQNQLWARKAGQWLERRNPNSVDRFISVTGDGRGRAWLVTSGGRIFFTENAGETFEEDSSGFGHSAAPAARKACFAEEPDPTLWVWATSGPIWQRGGPDPNPTLLPSVADAIIQDISAAGDGLLWFIKNDSFGRRTFTTDGISSPRATPGGEEMFLVAATLNGRAWGGKSDGSLWEFAEA